uniref:Uncharacterized protein n=1 Tax=Coccolithus braarudii TaxID=221442 RepID=A0A7S0LUA4_9EUKA|mmetsp:Transcript_6024/g.13132  ORF Transcript_6024/g.13132 Transcript_6024/m.13132 type:complete len:127 (+) Transcript_6024:626-1006(+)
MLAVVRPKPRERACTKSGDDPRLVNEEQRIQYYIQLKLVGGQCAHECEKPQRNLAMRSRARLFPSGHAAGPVKTVASARKLPAPGSLCFRRRSTSLSEPSLQLLEVHMCTEQLSLKLIHVYLQRAI